MSPIPSPTIYGAVDENRDYDTAAQTPVIDTNVYADGDLIGTKLTFTFKRMNPDGFMGMITNVRIIDDDDDAQSSFDLVLFDADPTNTTFTDNDPFAPTDADNQNLIGFVPVSAVSSWSTNQGLQNQDHRLLFNSASNQIFGALVARGTPTYGATDDLTIEVQILKV